MSRAQFEYDISKLRLINGGRFDYWVINHASIAHFIKEYGLKPIGKEFLFSGIDQKALAQIKETDARMLWPWPWPFPFPGGMKYPHLHYKDDIFVLEADQWKAFSHQVMEEMREKLVEAGRVSYDELMNITESLGHL